MVGGEPTLSRAQLAAAGRKKVRHQCIEFLAFFSERLPCPSTPTTALIAPPVIATARGISQAEGR
jgi:hypothetical protein